MKYAIFIVCCLLISQCATAQVVQIEVGSNAQDMKQLAIMAGFLSDINGSTFTGGIVHKQYKSGSKRTGIRSDVQIPIGNWLHFTSAFDAYFDKHGFLNEDSKIRGSFLELSSGLGLNWKLFYLNLMYQMTDFDPELNVTREDKFLGKFGVIIKL